MCACSLFFLGYINALKGDGTSVAVVYAVMVETGLNKTELGKIILAACFVTDLGTVLALGIVFASLYASRASRWASSELKARSRLCSVDLRV
jgi:Kef-type K+ transport system membrane component KefB